MTNFKFSSRERLKKGSEFRRVYKEGKRLAAKHFIWFCLKEESEASKKLGITITKNVGVAAERNRIKRQVREFFRLNKEKFPNGSVVIKARAGSANANNSELKKDLERMLSRIFN